MTPLERKNRRLTLEARRARKLERLLPTKGNARLAWLTKQVTSKYAPNECQKDGKR